MTMMHRAAWHTTTGSKCGKLANTAKYLAAEASFFAADQAMQTHGGLGYASEYHVERYWREARLQRIAPVSQEMTLNYIAQTSWAFPGATDAGGRPTHPGADTPSPDCHTGAMETMTDREQRVDQIRAAIPVFAPGFPSAHSMADLAEAAGFVARRSTSTSTTARPLR